MGDVCEERAFWLAYHGKGALETQWVQNIRSDEGLTKGYYSLRRRANARNVSFRISLRWLTYIVNSVDKTKLSCNTPHRRSTTVSLETYPLYTEYYILPLPSSVSSFRSDVPTIDDMKIIENTTIPPPIAAMHADFESDMIRRYT